MKTWMHDLTRRPQLGGGLRKAAPWYRRASLLGYPEVSKKEGSKIEGWRVQNRRLEGPKSRSGGALEVTWGDLEARHGKRRRLGEQKLRKSETWRLWTFEGRFRGVSGGVLALLVTFRALLAPSWRHLGEKIEPSWL